MVEREGEETLRGPELEMGMALLHMRGSVDGEIPLSVYVRVVPADQCSGDHRDCSADIGAKRIYW